MPRTSSLGPEGFIRASTNGPSSVSIAIQPSSSTSAQPSRLRAGIIVCRLCDVDQVWCGRGYLGKHVMERAFVCKHAKLIQYEKRDMSEVRPSPTQPCIEVPNERSTKTSLNLGNILIVGGLGYLLMRTFMMEERLNDLTVLVKRQNRVGRCRDTPPPPRAQTPTRVRIRNLVR